MRFARTKRPLPLTPVVTAVHVSSFTASRILTFFLYLSDVEEGGTTDFVDLGLRCAFDKLLLSASPPALRRPSPLLCSWGASAVYSHGTDADRLWHNCGTAAVLQ